jgi:hypothetical protein
MRLSCQKAFILVAASTMGCTQTAAPPISGSYVLESINGQPLPANIQAEAGDTIAVLSSSLNLDGLGRAQLSEHIRYVHPNSPPGDVTYTQGYSYRIEGSRVIGQSIVFDYSPPCPPNALCVAPPQGRFSGFKLILTYGSTPGSRPPSVYRSTVAVD